ncbi:zinc finger BED domain-containing protein 5 [Trichonephila inaurata madagascariensis]|uniref:Zinc finger BED domain-containing protein 5 n=1 Tax=Trichonephila inaurata madagascariensis TaxID=2747483 RepID=A0A8X6MA54_9ARAC|nr:zinc finger BED domain-containing protein 5 [Trichonephila inaurata madagascariensis]
MPVPKSYCLIFHIYHLPILDRWYQRKDINMILVSCRLDLPVLVTRRLQIRKVIYWISAVKKNNFERFQTLIDFLEESEVDLDIEISEGTKTYVSSIQQSLSDYFPILEYQDNYNGHKILSK